MSHPQLSVAQYHQLIHLGVLDEQPSLELLEGMLFEKASHTPPHRLVTEMLRSLLEKHLPAGWHANNQEPITLADGEPEPDCSIIRGNRRDFVDRHPGPKDAALVIEVADSSLQHDRGIKKRSYARAGIAVYWIINLVDRQIEVYSDPVEKDAVYLRDEFYAEAQFVPITIDGQEIARVSLQELLA